MVPDTRLRSLKAKYEFLVECVQTCEVELEKAKKAAQRAYAELDVHLNKSENTFQDTEGEGF